jgi:hypothetical protein
VGNDARLARFPSVIDGMSLALSGGMPNPLVHWELMVNDVERAKAFYTKIFDWSFTPMGPEYTLVGTGTDPGGGLMKRPPNVPMATLNSYFRVTDLDRTLHDAVEAGATVIVPRTEVPTIGWFAMFLDPDKIPVGIMQLR